MNRVLVQVIAQLAIFLEFAAEDVLELQAAVKQQEDMAFKLQQLTRAEHAEFIRLLNQVAGEWPCDAERAYLRSLAESQPTRSNLTTAEAFWHSRQSTGPNSYLETTWYVGVFASTDGGTFLFSDLYQDVEACTVDQNGNPSCTEVASKFGDSDLTGPGDTFTMDFAQLTSAHLDGTYQVQPFDQNGNPIGSPETEHIVADWTGTGSITKSHSKFSFHSRCVHFTATTKGRMRPADAAGMLNGTDLGVTTDTFFGGDATLQVDHSC